MSLMSQPASPFSLDQLHAIANRYAPIVQLHPDEQYFMCTVDWYLERGTLNGPEGYKKVSPTVNDLPTGDTDDGKYSLTMTDAAKPGDLSIARCYVHAYWQPESSHTDLQYWFAFGYNGPGTLHVYNTVANSSSDANLSPLGEHWVDWEQVTVRIGNDNQQVLGVFLSQHGEGQWITDLTQPGINPTDGLNLGVFGYYFRNDTAANGDSFDSAGKLEIVSADFVAGVTEPKWLHFPYRWGLGSDSHITKEAIEQILQGALGSLWSHSVLGLLAEAILPFFKLDDTNGVHGPQITSSWTSQLLPKVSAASVESTEMLMALYSEDTVGESWSMSVSWWLAAC